MGYWPVQFSSDKAFVQSIFQISTWKVFFIKNIFIMKNLTDFRKTLETGPGPHLFGYSYSPGIFRFVS